MSFSGTAAMLVAVLFVITRLGLTTPILTQRVRKLAALAWALGVSARKVVAIFADYGIELSHMVVWRDGNELISKISDTSYPGSTESVLD